MLNLRRITRVRYRKRINRKDENYIKINNYYEY